MASSRASGLRWDRSPCATWPAMTSATSSAKAASSRRMSVARRCCSAWWNRAASDRRPARASTVMKGARGVRIPRSSSSSRPSRASSASSGIGTALEGGAMKSTANAAAAGQIVLGVDLTVSRLGFGAMRITGPGIWGEPPNVPVACRVLQRAVQLGVNFIDTADSYGPEVSEQLIARALYPYSPELVIATKGCLTRPSPDVWNSNGHPEHLRESCEASLRRLRRERIDVYQLHAPDPRVPLAESIGELVRLQGEGKIRHIGVCNVSLEIGRAHV